YQDATGQLTNDAGQNLFLGKNGFGEIRRSLLKFDTSALPASALVVEARMQVSVLQSVMIDLAPTSLHRVTAAWTEGLTNAGNPGGQGIQATTGDTTWIYREYTSVRWTNPGGDFDPTPLATAGISFTGTFSIGPSATMNAEVQSWLAGNPNHGFLLRTDELTVQDARRIGSRQNANANLRPRLVVTYVPAGGKDDKGTGCTGSTGLALRQTIAGTPLRGTTCSLNVTQGPSLQPTVTMLDFRLATSTVPLVPGCPYELESLPFDNFGIQPLDANGAASYSLPIPNAAYLLGFSLAFQSAALDPTFPPHQLVVSNGSLMVIG
ncbi:MAG: DNRLRE domain-containing protein, partial [Planctomycetota bacterium]